MSDVGAQTQKWYIGRGPPNAPLAKPRPPRSTATKLLDAGHRVAVSAILLGTVYLGVQMATGLYQLRQRRVTWETEHPEELEAFVAKQKADKEAEKEHKARDKAERTALLKAKLAEEDRMKQLQVTAAPATEQLQQQQQQQQ